MHVLSAAVIQKVQVKDGKTMIKKPTHYVFGSVLLGLSSTLHAAQSRMDSADLFDSLLTNFHTTAQTWQVTLSNYAAWLFWSLALISMVVTFGFMALKKADIQEFFSETVRYVLVVGFFFFLLDNGPAIATAIIDSLRQMASVASGVSSNLSPSGIVDVGFDIASKAVDNSSVWSPAASMVGLLIAGIILVCFAWVGIQMLLLLISGWLLTYAGTFFLGFGGGRWTQDIAITYFKDVLALAVEAFSMILIIGIGKSFVDQYYALMAKDILLKEMFIMLVVAFILVVMMSSIPPRLSAIIRGGFGGGSGGGGGGGLGIGGAAATLGVAGAAAMAGASFAASQSTGGIKALSSAFKAASQSTGGLSAFTGGASSSTSKLGGLASAMGQGSKAAGQFVGSFGAHLAKGAGSAIKEQAGNMKASISEKASSSVGGKIADAISTNSSKSANESASQSSAESSPDISAQSQTNQPDSKEGTVGSASNPQAASSENVTPIIPEGSLSGAGTDSGSKKEEVDAFVNKSQGDSQ